MDRARGLTPRIANKAEIEKATSQNKPTEADQSAVFRLKKLYLETLKIDVEVQKQIYKLEKSFEAKHNKIYDERKKIIDECKKRSSGGDANEGKSAVSNFWLTVLKSSYSEFVTQRDEAVLAYLSDIRSVLHDENNDVINFVLEFYFDQNPYFTDAVLTKTYFINCVPDPEEPFRFTGADIVKCKGCVINWKEGHKPQSKLLDSFFGFFTPPELPGTENSKYDEIHRILRNDYELGFYLKERVIPKAVLYYTGEVSDCISSDEESDESYEEEESSDGSEEQDDYSGEEEDDKSGGSA